MNRAIIMGRLVADAELRKTPNGVSVTSFTVAVNRRFSSKDGERQADFIDVVAWRQTAEFISKYFQKGSMIALEGSIQTRTYQDKQGNNRKATEIVADQAYFCESKGNSSNSFGGAGSSANTPSFNEPEQGTSFSIGDFGEFEEVDTDDSELPF